MKPLSYREFVEDEAKTIDGWLSEHQILDLQSGSTTIWTVGKPNGSSNFKAQVIVSTVFHAVIVFGDIDPTVFEYYSGPPGPMDPVRMVEWIACSNFDYVLQKASIGTGHEAVRSWSDQVALYRIQEVIDDHVKEDLNHEEWDHVKEMIEQGATEEEVAEAVNEIDWEMSCVGEVPNIRVVHAWRMCKRLVALLDEAKAKVLDEAKA